MISINVLHKSFYVILQEIDDQVDEFLIPAASLNYPLDGSGTMRVAANIDHVCFDLFDDFFKLFLASNISNFLAQIIAERVVH